MDKKHSIPIVFGVTGHRDLSQVDEAKLKESVKSELQNYKDKYQDTQLILRSALAEGADILVSEVAEELNIVLHVVLPYEEKKYLESFEKSENKEKFKSLKKHAAKVQTLVRDDGSSIEDCYENLGKDIADTSNILLVLWDGKESAKKGGTAAIVEYARKGFEENRFDQSDGKVLWIFNTPRTKNENVNYHVIQEFLNDNINKNRTEEMFIKLNTLNKKIKDETFNTDGILKTYFTYFEKEAGINQTNLKKYSKIVLALVWFAILCLELMHNLHIDHFTAGYGLGLLGAFGIYGYFLQKGKVQDDFVYFRGLAEALRVQGVWNIRKEKKKKKCVSNYYLASEHHKYTWLRVVLKNLFYLDKNSFSPYGDENYDEMMWIEEQKKYFEKTILDREKSLSRLEWIESMLYKFGITVLVLMFVHYTLESLHIIGHHTLPFTWHNLVMVSGILLLSAVFIGDRYVKIEGYEEEIYNYKKMKNIFADAEILLNNLDNTRDEYWEIIYDLGRKALEENSKWVVLHDSLRIKPEVE